MPRSVNAVLALAFALILWQGIVFVTGVPKFVLPGPWLVAQTLIEERARIAEHALVTIAEIVAGLIIGSILGAATALLLMVSDWARRLLEPLLVFSQAIPVFALAPVLTLWLGYGLWSKIAMTVLIIYFPVASTFYDGLRRTESEYLNLAHCMNATAMRVLLLVRVPAAIPSLASGLRLAAVYAPIGAVIGEWVGASKGLGYLMLLANGRAKIDLMFAALIILACIALLLRLTINGLAAKLTGATGQIN